MTCISEEDRLTSRFVEDRPMFEEWGKFVIQEISESIKKSCEQLEISFEEIIKITPSYRVKDINSFITKALYRKKEYNDCYNDITDKVGVRFVVLLSNQIPIVKEAIEKNLNWKYSEDRNFELERREYPDRFGYESVHYVLYSNNSSCMVNEEKLPNEIPCEVQIRTLLQHAYAEMSHDTVYKSSLRQDDNVYRLLARSMALIESADHFFVNATDEISKASDLHNSILRIAYESYPADMIDEAKKDVNNKLVDDLIQSQLIRSNDTEEFQSRLDKNKDSYLEIIQNKHEESWIYKQPIVFVFYYLIQSKKNQLKEAHIFPDEFLERLYSDLGESYSTY